MASRRLANAALTMFSLLVLVGVTNMGHAGTLTVQENYATPDHFWCQGDPDPDNEMASIEGVAGPDETISWDSITLQASGTGDDSLDISSVKIWADNDDNGKVSAPDSVLGAGAYPADNGAVTIALAPPPIMPPGGSLLLVISYTMSASAPVGATYSLDVIGAAGTGQTSGMPVIVNLNPDPLPGATKTVSPQMTVQQNHTTPDHFWCQGDPDPDNEMASIEGVAGPDESISWDSITLQASGTGNDSSDISSVNIWEDDDNDGKVSAADTMLGSGTYPADNGAVSIALAPAPILPAGGSSQLVISYAMSASAPVGATYSLDVIGASGTGQMSGMPVVVILNPDPLPGATKTVSPQMTVQEHYATPDHFWREDVWDPDNEMASIEGLVGPDESISWDSITLQASGTGDDLFDISSVSIWEDDDNDGKVSASDILLGTGTYPTDNGAVSIALAPAPIIPPGGSLLLVISYTMSASAPVGATYSLDVIGASGTGQTSGMPVVVILNPDPLPGATKIVGPEPLTIGQAKTLSPVGGYTVLLEGEVLTADFTGELNLFYIEELGRSAGIGVYPLGPIPALQPNDRVSVMGTTMLLDGTELVVTPEHVIVGGNLTSGLPAVCMRNRDTGGEEFGCQPGVLGASGLNNIGLLITTWGTVTQMGPDYLYIDDGSNLKDGTLTGAEENVGVRVICDPSGYAPGEYLVVTGISSCFETPSAQIARRVLTRRPDDLDKVWP